MSHKSKTTVPMQSNEELEKKVLGHVVIFRLLKKTPFCLELKMAWRPVTERQIWLTGSDLRCWRWRWDFAMADWEASATFPSGKRS